MTGPAGGPGVGSGTRPAVDVLIPAFERPGALVATLATLVAQTLPRFRVVVSDQTEQPPLPIEQPEVVSLARILRATGRSTELVRHVPRRGMAEHRQSLLDRARAPFALFLDADVALEGDLLARLLAAIERSGAGFVGSAVVGASFIGDVRPHEEAVEFWDGAVVPEEVTPEGPGWDRYRLHNAANLHHVRE
ncbi:MAG: glycosyltransferase family 2 protein, partial [Chloroflexota bacterium]